MSATQLKPFAEARRNHPDYAYILDRIAYLAALDRHLTEAEDAELASLHDRDTAYRLQLRLV